jgi:peptide/nickel transport system permease protein
LLKSFATKLGGAAATMIAVSLLIFLLLEFNTDSVAAKVLGQFSTADQRHQWLQTNGYFDPFIIRYLRWLIGFVTGHWGVSTYYHADILELIRPRLAASGMLAGCALLITVPTALFLGIAAGMKESSGLDRMLSIFAILTTSVPEFASAVFLSAIFVFKFGLLPGVSTLSSGANFRELALPTLVLTISASGYISRMTRASVAEVMTSPYVRTARLKGCSTARIIRDHVLRNAMVTPVTVIMLHIPWLLSGVIVVEVFFAYPGFGTLLYQASINSDIYLIEACAMVGVVVVVASQILSDLICGWLNPRLSKAPSRITVAVP